MTCEITAQDLWLSIRLHCATAGLLLTFEIKVNRNSTIKQFRTVIFAYAIEILSIREKETNYRLDHLHLNKSLTEFRRMSASSPRIAAWQVEGALISLQDEGIIGHMFDFVSCYVVGTFSCGETKGARRTITINRDESSISEKPDEILKKTLAVRKVKIEETKKTTADDSRNSSGNTRGDSRCIGCHTF